MGTSVVEVASAAEETEAATAATKTQKRTHAYTLTGYWYSQEHISGL